MEADTIDLWEAIRQMRKLSSEGKTFSFTHATWNEETQQSNGIRHVPEASLRPAGKGEDVANADMMLFYMDESIREPRKAYQILVMQFNGMRCILN